MFKWFKKKQPKEPVKEKKLVKREAFSTDIDVELPVTHEELLERASQRTFQRLPSKFMHRGQGTMDDNIQQQKALFSLANSFIPTLQLNWFANQGFIGYQMCAILAQHWLVAKSCFVPARDAIRKNYELTVNDGTEIAPEVLDEIRKKDVEYRVNYNLEQFVGMGRVFGIRIAMFKVVSPDKFYYEKPFNPDGITPNSYKGIAQIDPYWIAPELDTEANADPSAVHFYEPTWWVINGKKVHRTHLIIMRGDEVADILKPTYFYGGISVPQKIYERVYAAERTANEAPELALTKRSIVLHTDLTQVLAKQHDFEKRLAYWTYLKNNYGTKVVGTKETVEQFDTSLNDLDAVIMTQYQIVAAAANVPATKLLGTSPKGFNTTGEFEESNYHEELESIQAHNLTPLLDRHHMLLIRSEIVPKFGIKPFDVKVEWNPLDAMTAKEKAEVNKLNAEAGSTLVQSGAIDGEDERQRLINDPMSGYNGIPEEKAEAELTEPSDDSESDPPEIPLAFSDD
jgi:uncharacterized protein